MYLPKRAMLLSTCWRSQNKPGTSNACEQGVGIATKHHARTRQTHGTHTAALFRSSRWSPSLSLLALRTNPRARSRGVFLRAKTDGGGHGSSTPPLSRKLARVKVFSNPSTPPSLCVCLSLLSLPGSPLLASLFARILFIAKRVSLISPQLPTPSGKLLPSVLRLMTMVQQRLLL